MRKEERNENGEREREKPEEGRGSRQKSYDVWTLASHPAERSISPKPLVFRSGAPGSTAPVLTSLPDTPARRRRRRDAQSKPPRPVHPSPPLPGPRSPPNLAPDFSQRPHHQSQGKKPRRAHRSHRWGNQKGVGKQKNCNNVIIGLGGPAGQETRGRHLGRDTLLQIPRAALGWAVFHKRKFGRSAAVCNGKGARSLT